MIGINSIISSSISVSVDFLSIINIKVLLIVVV